MPLIGTLTDDFTDGVLDTVTRWPESYGPVTETGGRAQIPCTTGYNGLRSSATYTLAGSGIHLQVSPPAPGGGASTAASVLILSSTAGTDAGFIIDTAQSAMGLYLRQGYFDAGAVFLTYVPADHRWLRLREVGGDLLWDTSSNGVFWTNRRTAPSPAWLSGTDLSFLVEGHRDAGTPDVVEIDNVNSPPGQAIQLGTAAAVEAAQPAAGRKARTLSPAAATEAAQSIARSKARTLSPASAIEAAQSIGYDLDVTVAAPYSLWEVGQPW